MTARILVVEDDPDISLTLCGFLRQAGYGVSAALDGLQALEHFHQTSPDLLLLDWMLPRLSGLELLRCVREGGRTPVILLTARASEADVLEGFRAGADDYVTKPFRMHEVLARVAAVLRRAQYGAGEAARGRLEVGSLSLDCERREARLSGEALELTVSEFEVLETLLYPLGTHRTPLR